MKIILMGAKGKMGEKVFFAAKERHQIIQVDKRANKKSDRTFLPDEKADVLIDFSSPSSLEEVICYSKKFLVPCVICTTGHSEKQLKEIEELSKSVPVALVPNTSVGANMLVDFSEKVAKKLNPKSVKITEVHSAAKKDIPIHSIRKGDVIGIHKIEFNSENEEFTIIHKAKSRDIFATGAVEIAEKIIFKECGLYRFSDFE